MRYSQIGILHDDHTHRICIISQPFHGQHFYDGIILTVSTAHQKFFWRRPVISNAIIFYIQYVFLLVGISVHLLYLLTDRQAPDTLQKVLPAFQVALVKLCRLAGTGNFHVQDMPFEYGQPLWEQV